MHHFQFVNWWISRFRFLISQTLLWLMNFKKVAKIWKNLPFFLDYILGSLNKIWRFSRPFKNIWTKHWKDLFLLIGSPMFWEQENLILMKETLDLQVCHHWHAPISQQFWVSSYGESSCGTLLMKCDSNSKNIFQNLL